MDMWTAVGGVVMVLCFMLIGIAASIYVKLQSGDFDRKPAAADNTYTVQAAEANQKAAEAEQKVAEANLRAEQLRLERRSFPFLED